MFGFLALWGGEGLKKVGVVMGSDSDLPMMKPCIETLQKLKIPFTVRVLSAHRTPLAARAFSENARAEGYGVIIAAAGKAAHLAGALAAGSTIPVIGVPVKSSHLGGMEALLSTVEMPSGIPVATVAIDGAKNAALLAAEILSISEDGLAEQLDAMRVEMETAVLNKDRMISQEYQCSEELSV